MVLSEDFLCNEWNLRGIFSTIVSITIIGIHLWYNKVIILIVD